MDKKEVLFRLCVLVTEVGSRKFLNAEEHDCFCGMNPLGKSDIRVSKLVIEFIEECVRNRLNGDDKK